MFCVFIWATILSVVATDHEKSNTTLMGYLSSFQLHYIQIQHTITYIDEWVCTVHAGFHLPVLSVLDKVYVGGTLAAVCLCTITYTPTHVYYMHTLQACIPSTCRLVSDKCYSTWYSSCCLRMYSVVWAICCSYSATSALVL